MPYLDKNTLLISKQMTKIMLNNSDAEILLSSLTSVLGEIFAVQGCAVVMFKENTILSCVYWELNNPKNPVIKQNLTGKKLVLELKEISQTIELTDRQIKEIYQDLQLPEQLLGEYTGLGISCSFQNQKNGIIVLWRNNLEKWQESEKELLQTVSEQIAIAIAQIQWQRQVNITNHHTNLINNLTTDIRNATNIEDILQLSMTQTTKGLGVDRGMILLLKYADHLFTKATVNTVPKARINLGAEYWNLSETQPKIKYNSFSLTEHILSTLAFTQSPLVITDINEDNININEKEKKSCFELEKFRAIAIVKLENQGTILGFLVVQNIQPRLWLKEELELMQWVSQQVSNALIQHQTLRQVQAIVEERTAQLQRSLEVQAKLYEKTRQQIDQLRAMNQLKDDFIDTISHELKTPLASMKLAICNLQRQPEPSPEKRAIYLKILEQQCQQEINLIQDLLALQKLESHQQQIQVQNIDLKLMLESVGESFTEKWEEKGVNLEMDLPLESLFLETDYDSLERILVELLNNGGKYSLPDTTVKIDVKSMEISNLMILKISNIGRTIVPEDLEFIFDKFRRGKGVTQQAIQGTGLGLALVKSLIQHINGTITVNCDPLEDIEYSQITFTLTLPQILDQGS